MRTTQLKAEKAKIQAEITTIQNSFLTKETFGRLQDLIDRLSVIEIELEAEARNSERILRECDIGKRFADRTFRNFEKNEFSGAYQTALDYANGFRDNHGEGLFFTGTAGTGKTHLAAAITNHIVSEYKIPVKFISYVDFLEDLKSGFGKSEDDVKRLNKVPLVVIDDLGKERTSDWSNSVLYRIVNMRYEHRLPIIITTNETLSDLENTVGVATISRLLEMCRGVKMVGADYRKQKLIKK